MDNILLNLKILSKIQQNGRISRSYDGIISIEEESAILCLTRMVNRNSRIQSMKDINNIISTALEKITDLLNSKYLQMGESQSEKYIVIQKLTILLKELTGSCKGITNLKTTYHDDPQIISEIDLLLTKIQDNLYNTELELQKHSEFVCLASLAKEKNI